MLEPDVDQPTAEITLQQERVVHGRLFDLQGRPVPGVTLSVASIRVLPTAGRTRTGSRFDGVAFSFTKINDLPGWPKPMTTDAEGRYTLRGLGQEQSAVLIVHHPRFALQRVQVEANAASESKPLTAALAPAQIITGRVTYADTGKGVPHAALDMLASQGRIAIPAEFETDADGRFRLNPPPADRSYNIRAYPPEGEPYLIVRKRLEWPKGALEQSLDIVLPRGILIHGKVTEEGSGKPVVGASVAFVRRADQQRPEGRSPERHHSGRRLVSLRCRARAGLLLVRAANDDYVPRELGLRMIEHGEPGGLRAYSHAFRSLDLKPGVVDQRVDLVLRRGATVTGHVVGPDGQPVVDALVFCRAILDPQRSAYRAGPVASTVKCKTAISRSAGSIPIPSPRSISSTRSASWAWPSASGQVGDREPVTAGWNLVAPPRRGSSMPAASRWSEPYPRRRSPWSSRPARPTSRGPTWAASSRPTMPTSARSTRSITRPSCGPMRRRLKLPALIPGANYRFVDWSTAVRGETGPQVRKEFTVKPGETLDLGDLVIEKHSKTVKSRNKCTVARSDEPFGIHRGLHDLALVASRGHRLRPFRKARGIK